MGHEGAKKLATYWVGQGIGLVNEKLTAGQTVQKFKEEFIDAVHNNKNVKKFVSESHQLKSYRSVFQHQAL